MHVFYRKFCFYSQLLYSLMLFCEFQVGNRSMCELTSHLLVVICRIVIIVPQRNSTGNSIPGIHQDGTVQLKLVALSEGEGEIFQQLG